MYFIVCCATRDFPNRYMLVRKDGEVMAIGTFGLVSDLRSRLAAF